MKEVDLSLIWPFEQLLELRFIDDTESRITNSGKAFEGVTLS